MRKVLVVTAITAVGMALPSCSGPPSAAVDSPTTSRTVYEPSGRVARAPLSPPVGYASPQRNSPTPLASYGSPNEGAEPKAAAPGEWRASPRWATVKGKSCIVVEQDAQAKFGVEKCSKEDFDAGNEVSAPHSNMSGPDSSPNSHEPEGPSGSDEPSPSNPYGPMPPPTKHRSNGMIEPWTGAI